MLKIATLIATLVAASTLATQAEAHGMGSFYASPFFRNQGREPAPSHCARKHFREEAFFRARERRLRELQAERAAAAAAAAKRARLAALRKHHDAAQTAALKDTSTPSQPTGNVTPKKDSPASQNSKVAQTTKTAQVDDKDTTAKSDSLASPVGCRSYSPAVNGLVDVPCK